MSSPDSGLDIFFTVFCIYYLFLYYLLSTRILGAINYFMSGQARPVCIRARPGPFKLIYFPARPGPRAARPVQTSNHHCSDAVCWSVGICWCNPIRNKYSAT